MTSTWVSVPLREVAPFLSGGTPRKSNPEYWSGDIPWISGATLHETRLSRSDRMVTPAAIGNGTRLAPAGSTLVLVRGMSLLEEIRVGRAVREVAFNQDVKALVPDQHRLDPHFLTYSLLARRPDLLAMVHLAGHGTGVLGTDRLGSLLVSLPPLDEQRRIAEVLGALDDLIEVNRGLLADLNELRNLASAELLRAATDSRPLRDVARFVNGKNFTKDASGIGRPVIRTPELRSGPSAATVMNDIDTHDDFVAHAGDMLFVWSGSLMAARWFHQDGLINQHIFKVIPCENLPDWLVFAQVEHQMPWFLGLAADKATTMGHIQRSHLDAVVPMPSQEAIERAANVVQPLWDAQLQLSVENLELTRTRDELLPLLMSGKVRVSEVVV